jgi:CBS domain-containing protein
MKTSSIGYRVADFLRRHPPFNSVEEDELLELVQGGRVQFHEDGEIVFQQGQPRRRFVYVIQQGMVRLVEEHADGEVLRDVRGEGDLLGAGLLLGDQAHRYTARTETDVILYALPIDAVEELLRRHPRVARFLSAYFSVARGTSEPEGRAPRSGEELRLGTRPPEWMDRRGAGRSDFPVCEGETPAREVAALLAQTGAEAAAVVDPQGLPLGLITPRTLSDAVASGKLPAETPARSLLDRRAPVAPADLPVGEYLLRMLDARSEQVLLTADGTPSTPVVGLISRGDLTRIEGAAPLAVVEDMARAPNVSTLARLRLRAEAIVAAGLSEPAAMRWLGPMAAAFNAAALQRIVALVERALENEGLPSPGLRHCWVFFGSAGRRELLTRHDLDHGLIYEDPPAPQAREARGYFLELGRRVTAGLAACGFVTSAKGIVSGHPSACRSVEEWRRAFSAWILDPVESCVYRATSLFDLRPVCGDCRLVEDLVRHIHAKEDANPGFVPLLASGSMENLPPLTFFRGLVVDDEGVYADFLDLHRASIQPIVDMARALALDSACRETETLGRLAGALASTGDDGHLLEEAAAAFRVALYHRARNGIANGTDGHRIDPTRLTRFEQNLLKSGFHTVLQLMEYTARHYGITPRR